MTITDLGSTHGTFINGVRLTEAKQASAEPHPISVNDELWIGHLQFRYSNHMYLEQVSARRTRIETIETSTLHINHLVQVVECK